MVDKGQTLPSLPALPSGGSVFKFPTPAVFKGFNREDWYHYGLRAASGYPYGGSPNYQEAIRGFEKARDYKVARWYLETSRKALHLKNQADQKQAGGKAEARLGWMIMEGTLYQIHREAGQPVEAIFQEGLHWLRLSAEQYGFQPAVSYLKALKPFLKLQAAARVPGARPGLQYEMGKKYQAGGPGIHQDFHEAVDWFLKSARQGHLNSLYELSRFTSHHYTPGLNTPAVSDGESYEWLNRAAQGGHTKAQISVGLWHLHQALQGQDLSDPHFKMARLWLEKSQVDVNSEYLLAVLNSLNLPREGVKPLTGKHDPSPALSSLDRALPLTGGAKPLAEKTLSFRSSLSKDTAAAPPLPTTNQKRWQSVQKKSAKLLPEIIVFSVQYIKPWYLKVTKKSPQNPSSIPCQKVL